MKKFYGKGTFDMTLKLDDDFLLMVTPLASLPVGAYGKADVQIQLPGHLMIKLMGTFPAESIRFYLNGPSLKIDRMTMPCKIIA